MIEVETLHHVSIAVTTLEHLGARGVIHQEKPRNKTPWPQIYLTDPDGNVIELDAERLD